MFYLLRDGKGPVERFGLKEQFIESHVLGLPALIARGVVCLCPPFFAEESFPFFQRMALPKILSLFIEAESRKTRRPSYQISGPSNR